MGWRVPKPPPVSYDPSVDRTQQLEAWHRAHDDALAAGLDRPEAVAKADSDTTVIETAFGRRGTRAALAAERERSAARHSTGPYAAQTGATGPARPDHVTVLVRTRPVEVARMQSDNGWARDVPTDLGYQEVTLSQSDLQRAAIEKLARERTAAAIDNGDALRVMVYGEPGRGKTVLMDELSGLQRRILDMQPGIDLRVLDGLQDAERPRRLRKTSA